ncbi:thioesterase family protein [Sneathiella sp.]|uniref:acyl-CoA thioesterase n=1 Tax=Sneathiella sp. TaxID=1964365 RepID=UPI00261A081C|nr:thioesterase family protein [Sneathiella sp.]MDF2365677.1 thioesterase family protein [Sneathiella sp.]
MNKLLPLYRGGVEAWECDQMRHMNVQFYMSKGSDAFAHLQNALGLSPSTIRATRKGLRFKTIRTQYKSEVHAGTALYGMGGIREVSGDILTGFIHIFDAIHGRLSAVYEFTADYADYDTDASLPLPGDIRAAAEELTDPHPDVFHPEPFAGTLMPNRPLDHMFESTRGSVDVWECDQFDHIEMRHVVGYFSDAATHIINAVGLTREIIRSRNLGSAALDYYSEFHAPIRKSTAILLKSGLIGAEKKIFRFGHNLINMDTGELAVTTTVIGVYFDMTTRKSVPLPKEFTDYPAEKLLKAQM